MMDGRKREEEKLDSCRLKNSDILRLFFNRYFIKAKINEGYCIVSKIKIINSKLKYTTVNSYLVHGLMETHTFLSIIVPIHSPLHKVQTSKLLRPY